MEGLDTKVNYLSEDTKDLKGQIRNIRYFTSMEQLGLSSGSETIETIVRALPPYSTLLFHKTSANGNNAIYPNPSGALTVTKFALDTRVSFKFERAGTVKTGFYDSLSNPAWSGWSDSGVYNIYTSAGNYQPFPAGNTTLSDFKTPGDYYLTGAQVSSLTDPPATGGGFLKVRRANSGDTTQEFYLNATTGARGIKTFRVINSSVGPWFRESVTLYGTVAPEGSVIGSIGCSYINTSNGKAYLKTSDGVNTGWKEVSNV